MSSKKVNYKNLWEGIIAEWGVDSPEVNRAYRTAQQLTVLPGRDWWRALVETFHKQQQEGN